MLGKKVFAMLVTAGACTASAATVSPADDGRALDNPGMGWTFQYYSNDPFQYGSKVRPGDSLAWFPGCNVCYLRLPWSYVEPEEGVYNWSALDTPAQRWIARGGKVAFRITCCESWLEYATPKWVFDAGAKGIRFNHGWGPDGGPNPKGKCIAPVYDDPILIAKLRKFLKAFAARYDGRKEVAFIDIGTFGCWGEGHTGSSSRLERDVQERQVRLHVDLHTEAFRKTQLVLARGICCIPSATSDGSYENYVYMRERGVTWRDDGIMCQPPPRSFFSPKPAAAFWPTLPVVLEHEHYSSSKARGAWSGEILEQAVEVHHASYLSIHGDPKLIYAENSNAVARINRRLGYRFNPLRISWPDEVTVGERGEPFEISWTWSNVGVAPSYRNAYPALTVKNAKGEIMAVLADADFNLKTLPVGEPGRAPAKSHAARHLLGRWQAPTFAAGDYDVYVSVGECDGTPVVELPLGDSDGRRRYRIGRIRFRASGSPTKTAYAPRMDRTKLQIGAYCLAPHERDEAHVKDLKDCGIDFLYGIPLKDRRTLDLFAKYGLGCIAVEAVPFWNGADGSRAGQMATARPLRDFVSRAAETEDHPAVWMVDFCDEPSALDFPHIAKVAKKMKELYPKAIPYVNLYPNYASVVQNTGAQTVNQLGTATYAEHILQYVRQIPLDYISYDFYVYSAKAEQRAEFLEKYYDNLRIVAEACRGSGKSLWFIPQVNSRFGELWLSENMLRFQAWTAMAFGAEVINWACWGIVDRPEINVPCLNGWWTNNVLTLAGERTEQYDKLKKVNGEIHRLGERYMRYRSVATHFVGGPSGSPAVRLPGLSDVRSENASMLVVGEMTPRTGKKGTAAFVVAADDPFDEKPVRTRILFKANRCVRVLGPGGELAVEQGPDGCSAVPLVSNSAVLLEVAE